MKLQIYVQFPRKKKKYHKRSNFPGQLSPFSKLCKNTYDFQEIIPPRTDILQNFLVGCFHLSISYFYFLTTVCLFSKLYSTVLKEANIFLSLFTFCKISNKMRTLLRIKNHITDIFNAVFFTLYGAYCVKEKEIFFCMLLTITWHNKNMLLNVSSRQGSGFAY